MKFKPLFILYFFLIYGSIQAQQTKKNFSTFDNFFAKEDSFNRVKFYSGIGIGAVAYGTASYSLYNYWYKEQGFEKFHLFNDWGEWQNMDKMGHIYTAYNQSIVMYDLASWTGLHTNKSIVFGSLMGILLQSTIEIMDGFSPKWGFSIPDMAANFSGSLLFYLQQKYWGQQKIVLKETSWRKRYSTDPVYSLDGKYFTTLEGRADRLYGTSIAERYLKDYNVQTYWLSVNFESVLGIDDIPSWLNLAIGYSGENMFGGFKNEWVEGQAQFDISKKYPRYAQILIAPDIDFNRIRVSSHFLKTIFKGLNIFKLPTPAIEINTKGEFIFHLLYY